MKYRKRPVEVEAIQWFPGMCHPGVEEFAEIRGADGSLWPAYGICVTIHGQRTTVQSGDWLITEPDGVHHYPCKPEIFDTSYEPVYLQGDPP